MNRFSARLLLACALLYAPFGAAQAENSAWTEGGLQRITVKGLDAVYAKPGASFAGYNKVLLRPISVSFHKDWAKSVSAGAKMQISASDTQRIRDRLAKLVREEVVKELNDGGYKLVDAVDDDVLDVEMDIVNLHVVAPALTTGRKAGTYAVSAGEMTLILQLRDSATGDTIARALDRALASESFRPMRIDSVDNEAEARKAASGWAKALRSGLDRARGIGAKS
jgi:hypothetical protein